MTKKDLTPGMIVETRNRGQYVYTGDNILITINNPMCGKWMVGYIELSNYSNDFKLHGNNNFDIVRIMTRERPYYNLLTGEKN